MKNEVFSRNKGDECLAKPMLTKPMSFAVSKRIVIGSRGVTDVKNPAEYALPATL
jgi:hypothetical protein